MKLACLATLCASITSAQNDVTVDWDKLLNFNADFSFGAAGLPEPPLKSLDLAGRIQLDLIGEKMKIWLQGTEEIGQAPRGHFPLPPGTTGAGSVELLVDGPGGTIGIRGREASSIAGIEIEDSYCLVVKPPERLPPAGDAIAEELNQIEPQAEAMLNQMPHTVEDGIVKYAFPLGQPGDGGLLDIQVYPDGVPIHANLHADCDEGCMQRNARDFINGVPWLELSFSNWQKGTGDLVPISCAEGSSTDLSANPKVMHTIMLFNKLMQTLDRHPETRKFAEKLPSLTPLYMEQMRLATEKKRSSVWSIVVVSLAAGMSGGAVVLMLAKAFQRKSSSASVRLLSEA